MSKKKEKQQKLICEQLGKTMKIGKIRTIPSMKGEKTEINLKRLSKQVQASVVLENQLRNFVIETKQHKKDKIQGNWTGKIGDNFLSYTNLRIFPYEVLSIQEMKIEHKVNSHGKLKVTAIIEEKAADRYINETKETSLAGVYYLAEEKPVVLFQGIVTKIQTYLEGDVLTLSVEIMDMSYLMDIEKKSRSFQDIKMTSHELIKMIMKAYPKSLITINIPNEPIQELVIQYKETDWEFLCRFVSRYYQGIVTKTEQNQICLTVGIPNQEAKVRGNIKNYKIYKDLKEYQYQKAYQVPGITETDYVMYEITRPEIWTLGEYILWQGQQFFIKEIFREIKEQVVKNRYLLQLKGGWKRPKIYNEKIIGISIRGKILKVKRDRVKVQMEIDNPIEETKAYWFPYSTVASSKDGGGWYCMPEIGEEVRVYFPVKEEEKAYAASAIGAHQPEEGENASDNRMADPNNKSLKTAQGQEIKFTPQGVLIESNGGESKIDLNLDGTVTVSGQKAVLLTCKEVLSIQAGKEIKVTAKESIDLLCEAEGNVILSEGNEVFVKGKNIKNNC